MLGKADIGFLPRETRRLRITVWWPEVNLGEGEARIRGFVERTGTTFPLLLDRDGDVKRAWRVSGVPTTFLVDAAGRIRYSLVGAADFGEPGVESAIAALLAKHPGKSGATRK